MAAGTLVTFCLPVVSVPAVIRRDGTVLAGKASWLLLEHNRDTG